MMDDWLNVNVFFQETVSNAPPLAWPWNVSSQMTSDSSTNAPPPLALSKSSILSEKKTISSNNSRNKRNHAPDTADTTTNKRNRTSNSNGKAIAPFFLLNFSSLCSFLRIWLYNILLSFLEHCFPLVNFFSLLLCSWPIDRNTKCFRNQFWISCHN